MHRRFQQIALAALLVLPGVPFFLMAHDGPPYPIMVDWKLGNEAVTVWSDPDVGIGTFFIVVESDADKLTPYSFNINVQPIEKNLPPAGYQFESSGYNRFMVEVPFASEGDWTVTIGATSGETSTSNTTIVAVTPPGLGQWDLLWFLIPFIGFGSLWIAAALRPKQIKRPNLT